MGTLNLFTKTNPYPGFVIKKAECVDHVQKRVGTLTTKNWGGKHLGEFILIEVIWADF